MLYRWRWLIQLSSHHVTHSCHCQAGKNNQVPYMFHLDIVPFLWYHYLCVWFNPKQQAFCVECFCWVFLHQNVKVGILFNADFSIINFKFLPFYWNEKRISRCISCMRNRKALTLERKEYLITRTWFSAAFQKLSYMKVVNMLIRSFHTKITAIELLRFCLYGCITTDLLRFHFICPNKRFCIIRRIFNYYSFLSD